MDSPMISFIAGIFYMFLGYIIKSNPHILPAVSSIKKDVVSMELSGKTGKQFLFWGLILLVATVGMYLFGFYRGYILLSILVSLLLICLIGFSTYSIKAKYKIRSKGKIIAVVMGIFILCIPSSLFFLLREPHVTFSSDSISLDGLYGCHIPIDAIEDVQLLNDLPVPLSTDDGFEILGVSRGTFIYEKWSHVHLLLQTPRCPYILIKTSDGRRILFNSWQTKKTTQYYHTIREQYHNPVK